MSVLVSHWLANAFIAYRRHRAIEMFSALNDRNLRDIGLERFDIESHVNASMPWQTLDHEPKSVMQPSIQGCG